MYWCIHSICSMVCAWLNGRTQTYQSDSLSFIPSMVLSFFAGEAGDPLSALPALRVHSQAFVNGKQHGSS